jgi:proteic killer suppression protein
MEVEFDDKTLASVEIDPAATIGHGNAVDRGFRKLMGLIRSAVDERDFYALKSLHFEKMQGSDTERSMRINKQWRVIVELRGETPNKRIGIIAVRDYH